MLRERERGERASGATGAARASARPPEPVAEAPDKYTVSCCHGEVTGAPVTVEQMRQLLKELAIAAARQRAEAVASIGADVVAEVEGRVYKPTIRLRVNVARLRSVCERLGKCETENQKTHAGGEGVIKSMHTQAGKSRALSNAGRIQ